MQDQRLLEGGRIRSHSIHIDDRRLISVTGVKDVDSFNEQFVQLLTEAGELRIEGGGAAHYKAESGRGAGNAGRGDIRA